MSQNHVSRKARAEEVGPRNEAVAVERAPSRRTDNTASRTDDGKAESPIAARKDGAKAKARWARLPKRRRPKPPRRRGKPNCIAIVSALSEPGGGRWRQRT